MAGQLGAHRRDFLRRAALGGGAMALAPWMAMAQQRPPGTAANDFRIAKVTAYSLQFEGTFEYGGLKKPSRDSATYVEVETRGGLIGHGITTIADPGAVAALINLVAGPAIVGDDALRHEAIWDKLYWSLSPRGQTGFAGHVMSAIDIALWDIKGKAYGTPIASLLGGARAQVPVYVTFGPAFLDQGELVAVARDMHSRGFNHLKMVVGSNALPRRDVRPMDQVVREDTARVAAVRAAVGPDAHIYVDGNCSFDLPNAERLTRNLMALGLAFFEEPITQNDVRLMADLRRRTGVTLAAGQNETLAYRFRDMMLAEAVDYVQPNVMIGGGYTGAVKIAGMAAGFNVAIANGGAGALQNMHMHAGLANGGFCEWHLPWMGLNRRLYKNMPEPSKGLLAVPPGPGLGLEVDRDGLMEMRVRG